MVFYQKQLIMSMQVFVEGYFPTGKQCKYHCRPSCHPAHLIKSRIYGCTNKAWEENRNGDFCPIVKCGGDPNKCEIKDKEVVKELLNK